MIKLEEKLYTSTEVAGILGVSLRSVYRYIEENKLHAEVKTATGRHRFTRQDILNFLYPEGVREEGSPFVSSQSKPQASAEDIAETPKVETTVKTPVEEVANPVETPATNTSTTEGDDDGVDWLSKFREAAKKFQEDQPQQPAVSEGITGLGESASEDNVSQEEESEADEEFIVDNKHYYKSGLGGLKEIAQNIDKSARNAQLPYAFTLNAGLSLHSPIKPFSLLHAYVRSSDLEFFEKSLQLVPSDSESSQICVITSDDSSVYSTSEELHGLFVVGKVRLTEDIASFGDVSLQEESSGLLE